LQPRCSQGTAIVAVVLAVLLFVPSILNASIPILTALWILLALDGFAFLMSVSQWFKANPVTSTVIASAFVVVGMWLERWNIIIPTVTHPMLVPYATYTPSLTEISIAVASMAGFIFMFLVFFKLFPAISIWELAEGRVLEEAQSKIVMPMPEANLTGVRRLKIK